jgi:hypothetical protein
LLSCKDGQHRLLLDVRVQMPVAAALLLCLMSYDVVDDALIRSLLGRTEMKECRGRVEAPNSPLAT